EIYAGKSFAAIKCLAVPVEIPMVVFRKLAAVRHLPRQQTILALALYGLDKRKNRFVPEMPLVTTLFVLTTTGAGKLVLQTDEVRLVEDCNVYPVALVGHSTRTLAPEGMM